MATTDAVLIYTTWPDPSAAEAFGQKMIAERLAACINIIPGMISIYEWQGRTERSQEVIAILKTSKNRIEELKEKFKAEHPYDCPCFLVLPIEDGLPDFLSWIDRQSR